MTYRLCHRLTLASIWIVVGLSIAMIARQAIAIDEINPVKISSQHLPNLIRVHARVFSGGTPEGDAGFTELKRLGVKTIISVDGATPDVTTANKYALRYVHLPHGYDGISLTRAGQLAKAVWELPGPIYIHCHHGKHRSPAAAGVACVGVGLIDSSAAADLLELAGTDRNYRGLFRAVNDASPIDPASLDVMSSEFPQVTTLPPLAEAMVAIDHDFQELKRIAASGWRTPTVRTDLDPSQVTLLLREHFAELRRLRVDFSEHPAYRDYLDSSETALLQIEATLATWSADDGGPPPILAESTELVAKNCRECHTRFRDNR